MANKQTTRRRVARWRANNAAKAALQPKESKYRNLYGLAISEVERLLLKQGGVCAICKQGETYVGKHGRVKSLSVDHCHTTGIIRGLLCGKCNHILGLCADNTNTLLAAIEYLKTANTGFRVTISPTAEQLLAELLELK